MNQINKQTEVRDEVAAGAEEETRPLASPSRRRLIKLGASAVPVLATLSSQSALAGQCISTSAWGSAQISNSASEAARHASHAVEVTTGYTISAWNSTDSTNAAWTAFTGVFGSSPAANALTFSDLSTKLGTIYSPYFWNPLSLGFGPSDLVMGHLTNDDKSYFLVAQLNYAVGAKPPTACVTDANWQAIVAGTYPVGNPWTLSQIRTYLENNYIVQG